MLFFDVVDANGDEHKKLNCVIQSKDILLDNLALFEHVLDHKVEDVRKYKFLTE